MVSSTAAAANECSSKSLENNIDGKLNVSGLAGKLTAWANRLNPSALAWIQAVKNGQDSMRTEDINTSMIKTFQEYRV